MKIHFVSDIHLEFGNFKARDLGQDLTILAGDIGEGQRARNLVDEYKKISPVVYVMGNHEYYHQYMPDVESYWEEQEVLGQLTLKEQGGLTFACGTMWSDFNRKDPIAIEAARCAMNDFRLITNPEKVKFTPEHAIREFDTFVKWLKWAASKSTIDVVVTHHAPSLKSIHLDRYGNSPLNYAYASDLEDLIQEINPKIWIHGHTHASEDYMVGNTRILSNARGYVGYEANPHFNPNMIVEV